MNTIRRRLVEEDVVMVPVYHSTNFYATGAGVEGFHTRRSIPWDLSA